MLSLKGNSEKSVDISRPCIALPNMLTFYVKLLSRVKHPTEGPPIVTFPRLLIQPIRNNVTYQRPSSPPAAFVI